MTKKIIIEFSSNGGYIINSENLECNDTGPATSISVQDTIVIVGTLLREEEKLKSRKENDGKS